MLQDETVRLEIDGQQGVELRGPMVQNSIHSKVAIKGAHSCLLWNFRKEEVSA
jgi:hypothetical protein